jgi:hypothetical protein
VAPERNQRRVLVVHLHTQRAIGWGRIISLTRRSQRRIYGPFTSVVQKMTLATTWPWATAYAVELN